MRRGLREISLGDFVLSGGEIGGHGPDRCLRQAAAGRHRPGAPRCTRRASPTACWNIPSTRARAIGRAQAIPDVLLSGDHKRIADVARGRGGAHDARAAAGFVGAAWCARTSAFGHEGHRTSRSAWAIKRAFPHLDCRAPASGTHEPHRSNAGGGSSAMMKEQGRTKWTSFKSSSSSRSAPFPPSAACRNSVPATPSRSW